MLVREAGEIFREKGRLARMGEAARTFAQPGAARRAADILEALVKPARSAAKKLP